MLLYGAAYNRLQAEAAKAGRGYWPPPPGFRTDAAVRAAQDQLRRLTEATGLPAQPAWRW
ncbi:hypothetical protein HUX88_24600 [Duganella sp. BJB1802]|uniref:hypothetical protein n=1 Tax=Duganella sp. BJB1802 TaxID=2744575 RepID=UPI0015943A53|nr:hypothetical protein [Duganella sp. BJB1802]NVD73695.1 hypothetical protein [Duganella sp. BJB1802]